MTNFCAQNNCNRERLLKQEDKDLSQVTCYNDNKKKHFTNQCIESHELKN